MIPADGIRDCSEGDQHKDRGELRNARTRDGRQNIRGFAQHPCNREGKHQQKSLSAHVGGIGTPDPPAQQPEPQRQEKDGLGQIDPRPDAGTDTGVYPAPGRVRHASGPGPRKRNGKIDQHVQKRREVRDQTEPPLLQKAKLPGQSQQKRKNHGNRKAPSEYRETTPESGRRFLTCAGGDCQPERPQDKPDAGKKKQTADAAFHPLLDQIRRKGGSGSAGRQKQRTDQYFHGSSTFIRSC